MCIHQSLASSKLFPLQATYLLKKKNKNKTWKNAENSRKYITGIYSIIFYHRTNMTGSEMGLFHQQL